MYARVTHPASGNVDDMLIMRIADGAYIPADPLNTDWKAYRAYLAAGNTPAPVLAPSRSSLDAAIGNACANGIAAGFSVAGVSMRGSMNLWLGAVVATQLASGQPPSNADDRICLAMAPKMNSWESAMFVERDRLIAAALTAADAKWPPLPDGGATFVASCAQG